MMKKKYLLITFILIIILQTFLYVKNNQNTSIKDSGETKSSLPSEENVSTSDLDDEIPF